MRELPKPVAWTWTIIGENVPVCASLVTGTPGRHINRPLFTAEQVAEFADSLLTDAEGWVTFRRELAEFRAAYCGAHTEEK